MRQSTRLSLIAVGLLLGLMAGRSGLERAAWLIPVALLAAILSRRSRWLTLCLLLLAFGIGAWRGQLWLEERGQLQRLIGRTVTLNGTVADDPALNAKRQVDFKLSHLRQANHDLPGELSVHEYPVRLQRGYRVQVSGRVKPGFGNTAAELSFPQLTILSQHQTGLEQLRQRFFAGIRTALPEPLASFGLGLLVGIRSLIPRPLQAELTLVGLSHLVAVSGYNLTILVQAAHRLLQRWGRGVALAASLWLIGSFLVVTGASASIVRASLVSALSLLATFYGRRFQPLTLILLTAAATSAYQPGYLTDVGWLLSFLAFTGILVIAPAVEARIGRPKPVLVRLLIESCAAQLLTLPLLLYLFGQLSIVAPVTNLLILPLVPLAMAMSFLAGIAGMIVPAFAGWLAWPALVVLGFLLGLIDWFARLPWAGRSEHITLAGMLVMYLLLAGLFWLLQRRPRPDSHVQKVLA